MAQVSPDCEAVFDDWGNIIGYECSGSDDGGALPGPPEGGGEGTYVLQPGVPPPPASDITFRAYLTTDAAGNLCVAVETVVFPGAANSQYAAQSEAQLLALLVAYPRCLVQPGDPILLLSTPLLEAAAFWASVPLPPLAPEVPPGRAIVGLSAYLVTGGQLTETFGTTTVFGPLALDATSTISVDWGDGTVSGPYTTLGAPYPDGEITHTYAYSGEYDITLTQTWTATWVIGPDSGTLGPRSTTRTLEDFPVFEIEAVRNR